MTTKQYLYAAGWAAIAILGVVLVVGFFRNPVRAERSKFDRTLADSASSDVGIDLSPDPDFTKWQRVVSSRADLWGPLVPPQKVAPPPPAMQAMLAGVEPTRNTMGSGENMRIQIRVDGKKEWFSKGQQVKGCTIEELTDADVLFTLVQDGAKHGIRLPRK